jgi:biotin carboxyl carrier protein
MKLIYALHGQEHTLAPVSRRNEIVVEIDGAHHQAQLRWVDDTECLLTLDGKTTLAYVAQDDDAVFIHLHGHTLRVDKVDPNAALLAGAATGGGHVHAPMPGVVLEHMVAAGDAVAAGHTLILIESMKLQIEIKAKAAGRVTALPVAAGSTFNKGDVLVLVDVDGEAGK